MIRTFKTLSPALVHTHISVRDLSYHKDRAHGLLAVRPDGSAPVMHQIRQWHPAYADAADDRIRSAAFSVADAQLVYARQHGHADWQAFASHLAQIDAAATGEPFLAALEAGAAGNWDRVAQVIADHPELLEARGTNGNSLLNLASALIPNAAPSREPLDANDPHAQARLAPIMRLLDAGANVHLANERGWTPLHQAGYRNDVALAVLLLNAGARVDGSAHGDGGTPLAAALFWGHAEVAALLASHGVAPGNLRIAAALGLTDRVEGLLNDSAFVSFVESSDAESAPAAARHRAFYRPHSGFPSWTPRANRQEVLNEALVWAAKSGATAAMPLLLEHGAQIDADPYRGTALTWAAWAGRVHAVQWLLDHGADVNARGTFGGPGHGQGITAAHLAAQNDRLEVLALLVDRGADLTTRDVLYGGSPRGWAEHDGKIAAAELLLAAGG